MARKPAAEKKPAPKKAGGKRKKRSGLTKQEEAFCQHYTLNQVGSDAVRHAFPSWKNKPNQDVAVKASKLLATSKIKVRLAALATRVTKIAEEKFDITAEKVLEEIAAIGFQNAEDYFTWGTYERPKYRKNKETGLFEAMVDENGQPITETVPFARLKSSDELTRQQKRAILSVGETISRTGDRVIEVKMGDKLGALKSIGQHLGMFKERVEHTGKDGGPIQQNVTLPDISKSKDPKEALKAFDAFRMGVTTANHAGGKPN